MTKRFHLPYITYKGKVETCRRYMNKEHEAYFDSLISENKLNTVEAYTLSTMVAHSHGRLKWDSLGDKRVSQALKTLRKKGILDYHPAGNHVHDTGYYFIKGYPLY